MNKVVHFEIPADDVERASAFYTNVFGWGMQSMPDMGYTLIRTVDVDEKTQMPKEAGAINGGMFKRTAELPVPVITIGVDDVDAALKKVDAKGGAILRGKMPVGDMGFVAYFKDTEGNVVGLWGKK
ncbi:MAG: VOC family protein [Candidatus Kerfeldbacteria bacterium]|nr:VOC family protein [Candidatus Kerfeldbacteria bacterium]